MAPHGSNVLMKYTLRMQDMTEYYFLPLKNVFQLTMKKSFIPFMTSNAGQPYEKCSKVIDSQRLARFIRFCGVRLVPESAVDSS